MWEFEDEPKTETPEAKPRPRRGQIPFHPGCRAENCPLPGSMSESTTGVGRGMCRFHFMEKDHGKWGALTFAIRKNLDVIRAAEKYRNTSIIDVEIHKEKYLRYFAKLGVKLDPNDSRAKHMDVIAAYINHHVRRITSAGTDEHEYG